MTLMNGVNLFYNLYKDKYIYNTDNDKWYVKTNNGCYEEDKDKSRLNMRQDMYILLPMIEIEYDKSKKSLDDLDDIINMKKKYLQARKYLGSFKDRKKIINELKVLYSKAGLN